jgi:sugar phosphate isomerase/epimerase
MAKRLQLNHVGLKSMHMPLEYSDTQLKAIAKKVRDAGLDLYAAGVIYMKSEEEIENVFRYATAADLKIIVGVPNHELLPLVEKKVKETNIKVAIHNHGPGDEVYPTPAVVYDKIKDLDKRIGLCIDIGHIQRLGMDPVKSLKKYADRLYDMHLKDVDKEAAEGVSVELGRGLIDLPAVIKTLKSIKYSGVMALEFEKDPEDVLPGLAECVGYANGVLNTI